MTAGPRLRHLTGATLRANADLRFIPAKALSSLGWSERGDPETPPVYAGALRPLQDRWIGIRAVDPLVAGIFRALRRPQPVPQRFVERLDGDADLELSRLILDGILEIEWHGRFVSGADASEAVFAAPAGPPSARGLIGRLSLAAVRYAATLPINDVERLAARMYFFNRAPATPSLRRRLPTPRECDAFLDVAPGGATRTILDRGWRHAGRPASNDDWSFWSPRQAVAEKSPSAPLYKLFVSPTLQATPDCLRVLVDTLLTSGTAPFKHGGGLYGLLRPDKIVAYFVSRAEMLECGRLVSSALAGVPPQGVPFSAGLGDGVVSWGIDPPEGSLALADRGFESWRVWITSRLARSLLVARQARGSTPERAVAFAVDRLRLDGVDPTSWSPLDR